MLLSLSLSLSLSVCRCVHVCVCACVRVFSCVRARGRSRVLESVMHTKTGVDHAHQHWSTPVLVCMTGLSSTVPCTPTLVTPPRQSLTNVCIKQAFFTSSLRSSTCLLHCSPRACGQVHTKTLQAVPRAHLAAAMHFRKLGTPISVCATKASRKVQQTCAQSAPPGSSRT